MTTRSAVTSALTLLLLYVPSPAASQDALPPSGAPSQTARPTFRSAVDLVRVAAVVRDKRGRFARNLRKEDFVVQEGGTRRDIIDFRADENAPVRVALLFDVSGSMRLSSRLEEARQAARHLLSALNLADGTDEAAVYSFDMNLQSLQPFTADAGAIESAISRVVPYGQTSLYDAVAETAEGVANTPAGDRHRRAVVVFTDGLDTSSLLKPEQVSAVASGIDVPVYVVTVLTEGERDREDAREQIEESPLRSLARWTGGDLFMTSAPAHESIAARQIVDELRHQYVLAFTASAQRGWRPLDVKTKDRNLTVRARSGYTTGARAGS
ncbi:MAG TPA: VWA domain-containing protein [Vicinamibacterales bacterium]|nr:VWA domain-containing protein [Vicinamibacterales bacterium]